MRRKVFISYHHKNDQSYKNELLEWNEEHKIFIDASVDTGDIDENIRQKIRDEYLRDSTVTILLVGVETKYRKHIDWEIYSSMYNGKINKQSGILVIKLPSTNCSYFTIAHGEQVKKKVYTHVTSWTTVNTRKEYEKRYPYMPPRITDNLLNNNAKISVVNWKDLNIEKLKILIDATFNEKFKCKYDLSRSMRKNNRNQF